MKILKQKRAFALSEILITLGVIGVIAAITLSVLINKSQMFILKNQYKRVYSNYSNALQRYILDTGSIPPDCTYGGTIYGPSCRSFFTAYAKRLKYIKYCNGNALNNKCLPKYKSLSVSSACAGFAENVIYNTSRVWVLNDNSTIITYETGGMPIFAVDINGMAGPNKSGYDLFTLGVYKKGDTAILQPSDCINPAKGGISSYSMLQNIYK